MRTVNIMVAAVIAVCVALGSAVAGMHGPRHGKAGEGVFHGGPGFLRMLDKLALNADQESDIASILGKHREEIGKTVTGLVAARSALREAVTAEIYSEDAVRQTAQLLGDQEEQAAVLAAQILSEVKPMLTVDQRQHLKDFGNRRSGRMQGFLEDRLADLDEWIAQHAR
jgi:Spy/CpxP family protein refolding chaperone